MCETRMPARLATWPIVRSGSSSDVMGLDLKSTRGFSVRHAMTDLPIACTLTPGAMTDRLAFIDKLRSDALVSREATPSGLRVRLRGGDDVERRVRELIAAES